MKKNQYLRYYCQICFSIIVTTIVVLLFILMLWEASTNDREFTGGREHGGVTSVSREDYVKTALDDIYSGRLYGIKNDIRNIQNDSSLSSGIKQYFFDFEEFYKFAIEKEKNYITSISTEVFIKSSDYIIQHFNNGVKKEDNLSRAAIVPYYFIKNYNSKNKKQAKEKTVYKSYIDKFVTGRASLDVNGANVICLYVYSCYKAASKVSDYANLKEETEKFLTEYKNYLGDNGDMSIQKTYLMGAVEILRKKPNGKGILPWNRIKAYTDL